MSQTFSGCCGQRSNDPKTSLIWFRPVLKSAVCERERERETASKEIVVISPVLGVSDFKLSYSLSLLLSLSRAHTNTSLPMQNISLSLSLLICLLHQHLARHKPDPYRDCCYSWPISKTASAVGCTAAAFSHSENIMVTLSPVFI